MRWSRSTSRAHPCCWRRAAGRCAAGGLHRHHRHGGAITATDELPDEDTPFNLWHSASHYVRSKYLGELAAAGGPRLVSRGDRQTGRARRCWRCAADGDRRAILAALEQRATSYPPGGINYAPVRDIALGHLLAAERGLPR